MRAVLIAVALSLMCCAGAWAQLTGQQLNAASQQQPPTKKTSDGVCHAPGTNAYAKIKDFIPFVALKDCLKSGGRLPGK